MFFFIYFFTTAILLALGYFQGDASWWLALVNSFKYWLFLPLIIFWIETLWEGFTGFRTFCLLLLTGLWVYWYLWFPFYEKPPLVVGQPFKVMTHNLLFKNPNIDAVSDMVLKANPDTVSFQEVTESQGRQLKEKLKALYPNVTAVPALDVLTFSKLKIDKVVQVPCQPGYAQLVKLTHPTRPIYLVNLHTESIDPLDAFGSGERIAQAYHRREEMIMTVFAYLKNNSIPIEDTIMVGDFNSTEGNNLYKIINSYGLVDAYRAVSPILSTSFTFPQNMLGLLNRPGKVFPMLRIDYVYAGAKIKPLKGQVINEPTGSDHKPVMVELGLI
jgi:endonuclease/exonuclease/phosphatase (EEP) superfamily protein YafD